MLSTIAAARRGTEAGWGKQALKADSAYAKAGTSRRQFGGDGGYSITYGSLGALIILLTWFYITGLMLLVRAEIKSEIEAAAAGKHLLELARLRPPAKS